MPDPSQPIARYIGPYPRVLDTMTREGFTSVITELSEDGDVHMVADMDVDVDGSGVSHGDPCFQPDTTLHWNGKALNSDIDRFIVVPPVICQKVKGMVLGSVCRVTNRRNGKSCLAVVGDIGPTRKNGEASRAVAFALDINPDPNNGGEDYAVIEYLITPGKAAVIPIATGQLRTYTLKPYA